MGYAITPHECLTTEKVSGTRSRLGNWFIRLFWMERIACTVENLKHEFWSDKSKHTGTIKYGTDFAACVRQTETDTPCGQLFCQ